MGYKAATAIKYSEPGNPEAQVQVFEEGDEVTGLPKDQMKALWDVGALVKTDEPTASEQPGAGAGSTPAPGPTPEVDANGNPVTPTE